MDRQVDVLLLGGTITMRSADGSRLVPDLGADELLARLGRETAAVRGETIASRPSACLGFSDIAALRERIVAAIAGGVGGIVIVQGTDSLEEVAFGLDLLIEPSVPVVVTGSMRGPEQLGSDALANLEAGIQAASSPELGRAGVCVCMNGELHAARFVRKMHTFKPSAFASPGLGPVGSVVEGTVRLLADLPQPPRIPLSGDLDWACPVALYRTALGDDGRWLAGVEKLDYRGVVVEAFGAGHVPPAVREILVSLARTTPVVLTSRTGAGEVLQATYGFSGSETDLLAHGLIWGGALDGLKARLLLGLSICNGDSASTIDRRFQQWGAGRAVAQ